MSSQLESFGNPAESAAPSDARLTSGGAVILSPGYHDNVPMSDYVRDRISPEPSLSTGVAWNLINRSPLHAWHGHPRLGGGSDKATPRGELGSAIHSLVLGGPEIVYVESVTKRSGKDKGAAFVPTDWMTADAKEARAAILAAGKIPLLPHQKSLVEDIAGKALEALAPFGPGRNEQTMLFQLHGAWCRSRADRITDDGNFDLDLKSCDSAEPGDWIDTVLTRSGYDLQGALRVRGHEALTGRTRDIVFVLVEIEPPYGCSLVRIGPAKLFLAQQKIDRAAKLWRRSLDTNAWPSYDKRIHDAEPKPWEEREWSEQQLAQEAI